MRKVKGIVAIIFIASLAISVPFGRILVTIDSFLVALACYLIFTLLYFNLRIFSKKGNVNIDYGTSYSMSFALFAGPLGLLIYQSVYQIAIYIYKKKTKTADTDELMDLFYNISAFVLANSLAFYLFIYTFPLIENTPILYWLLIAMLVFCTALLTDAFLVTIFYFLGEVKTRQEVIEFYKSRSLLDTGKVTITNGLLFIFLLQGKWEVIIPLFILDYLVNRSFLVKSQSLQDKAERDKFEQMAYTDFLTAIPNRADMDKKMHDLEESGELLGVVVADIDHFKHINDTYNHAVGDVVIQHFASFLQCSLEKDDYVFRSGGDEFTLFLRNRSYENTFNLVKTLQQSVEQNAIHASYRNDTISIQYTASFGLYYYKTTKKITLEKAHIHADNLLLQAKKLGRNRINVENGMVEASLPIDEMHY